MNDGRDTIDDSDADDDSPPTVLESVDDSVGVLSMEETSDEEVMSWSMSRNNISPCLHTNIQHATGI